jgi:hypothetical protein
MKGIGFSRLFEKMFDPPVDVTAILIELPEENIELGILVDRLRVEHRIERGSDVSGESNEAGQIGWGWYRYSRPAEQHKLVVG